MSSAIVRNCIANSTIDQILKNRDKLRSDIKEKLSPITSGWGVWLDSIEIIDVKILSGSLYSNLQCKFREDQNFTAKIQKLNVDHDITLEKAQHGFNKAIADLETNKTKSFD